ncbi:hypothetical protein [Streptomyces hokutonensis]|uniref:hypothetical protein n=1 Tax=Streptomyces hokutonensis TaxID=1306990 RepID=UPI0037FEA24B
MSADSAGRMVNEGIEGCAYGGDSGSHFGFVVRAVHGVGLFEEAAGLGDELGVPHSEQQSVDRLLDNAARTWSFDTRGIVAGAVGSLVLTPPPLLLGADEIGKGTGVGQHGCAALGAVTRLALQEVGQAATEERR